MNDKLLLENILLILKSNMEVYTHGTLESSNQDVRECIKYGLDTTIEMQNDLFQKMNECGWYQINNISTDTIKQTYNKVKNN